MEESKEWLEFERLRKKIQKKLNCGYGIVPGDSRPIEEHNRIMKKALRTGVLPDPPFEGILDEEARRTIKKRG